MKRILLSVLLICSFVFTAVNGFAAGDVTITSVAVPAGNMNQGSNSNIIYIAKLDVTTASVSFTNFIVNLTGTYNSTDISTLLVYFNANTPTIAGASLGNNVAANFAAPHSFNIPASVGVNAGSSVYVIIAVNINSSATDNHTVVINGATDPLTFTATVTPNITNNQTNAAGVQTIQASDVTLTTVTTPAANMNQGTNSNIIYVAKLDAATEAISLTNIIVNITGTYNSTDIGTLLVYFNTTAPTISGAFLGNNVAANFAGPHSFNIPVSVGVNAGSSVYVIIAVNINSSATDNHTVIINGATDPLTFTATTVPNIANNQTNAAGVQTIQASDVTLTTVSTSAANINQGSNSNILYIAKLDAATEAISLTNIIVNITGTYNSTDIGTLLVYFNTTAPTISGAFLGNNVAANFAGPHSFNIPASIGVNAGSSVYIIIAANIKNSATDTHTIIINGATDPLTFTATTVPNITNNQTNAAGVQTIKASDLAFSTVTTAAANINPGTSTNIIYIAKVDAGTEPVNITDVLFNLNGTYDNDDIGTISVYFNTTAPTIAGAFLGNNVAANFAGPHAVDVPASITINAGSTTYIIITVNVAASANDTHTIFINGATGPLTITATTVPNITNNQTNTAGVQTIRASDIIMSTVTLAPSNIVPGSNSNIIYALKMDVGTQPVTTTNVQITLAGSYDNDDLSNISVYANTTAPTIAGASLVNNAAANVAGPHTFSIPASYLFNAGTVSYVLFAVNVNSSATINNTVSVNGATDPVVFSYTTVPNVSNSQSNGAGVFKISFSALPLQLTGFDAKVIAGKEQVELDWKTASETNTKNFEIQWSGDAISWSVAGSVAAQGNSQVDKYYSYIHSSPSNGNNYYRLKMIDIDGKYTYSPIVFVKLDVSSNHTMIAPNPVAGSVRIVMNNNMRVKKIAIYNSNGQVVWQSASVVNTGVITIPFAAYSSGMYVAEVATGDGFEKIPFIKASK